MSKNKNHKISIGDVKGDVTISQNQSGGTTAHTVSDKSEKKSFTKRLIFVIGLLASIVTILAYLGLKPHNLNGGEKMKDKDNAPISVGDVQGNVVISQNQSGGITANEVNINTDRQIDSTVEKALIGVMKSESCQITVGVLGMGGEPDQLANQLLSAAQNAGCITKGVNHGIGFQPFKGIQIKVSQKNPLLNTAREIESILNSAGIQSTVVYGPNIAEGSIYLYVGYKP